MQTQRISRCVLLTVSAAATVLTVAGCSRPAVSDASSGVPLTLDEVSHWAYQIQDVASSGAVEALVASSYDMLVIEPTRTDKSSYDFDTAGMVTKLKDSGRRRWPPSQTCCCLLEHRPGGRLAMVLDVVCGVAGCSTLV